MRQKILIFSLLISIVPLLLIAGISFSHIKSLTETLIIDQLVSIADLKKDELQNWVLEQKRTIVLEAKSEVAVKIATKSDSQKTAKEFIQHIIEKHNCQRVFITDNHGQVLISSDKNDTGVVLQNEYINTPLSYSLFHIDDYSITAFGTPVIRFSAPIKHIDDSNVSGVLVLEFDLNIHVFPSVNSWPGMGATGETLIAKREGNEIVFLNDLRHRDLSKGKLRLSMDSKIALPAIFSSRGEEGIIRTADYRGQPVLAVYKHLPTLAWGFVAKTDLAEALEPIDKLNKLLLVISLVTMLFIIIIAFLVSNVIINPLKEIEIYSRKLASGDHQDELVVKSGGEIGSLADSIQSMEKDLALYQKKILKNEKLAAIGNLSASVAHDIRNPLGAISNSVYFIKTFLSNDLHNKKLDKHIDIISEETKRANSIVSDLMDFSRKNSPQLTEGNINNIIGKALEKVTIQENIQIEKELFADLPDTIFDKSQINRVFLNIIENAIQAMPEGGKLKITTTYDTSDIVIKFIDSGAGISSANLENIFEPLFTTKLKGVGLGLSIVDTFIKNNRGTIDCNSVVGEGTTFTISLPH